MDATLQADLLAVQAAIANAGTLDGAAPSVIAPILRAIETFSADLASAITTLDAAVVSGGMPGGMDPVAAAAFLLEQQANLQNEAALLWAKAYVDRISINLQNNAG